MSKNYLTLLVFLSFMFEQALGQSIVDCRVVASNANICNPYGEKLIRAKEIGHLGDTRKLIVTKTLPVPKKPSVRVISVEDMIEKYLDVEDSLRFKGSKQISHGKRAVEKLPLEEKLEKKIKKLEGEIKELAKKIKETPTIESEENASGVYSVEQGDTLNKIATKFGLETKELVVLNGLKSNSILCVGQELKLPFDQKMADAMMSAEYKVQEGDTLLSIANKFGLDPKALADFNGIKSHIAVSTEKTLKLPLPHILEKKQKYIQQRKKDKLDMTEGIGAHTLRVTATAYTSHAAQTSGSPFVAAWGTRLRSGMKIIAVSNDMLTRYGMRNGTRVRIAGLSGYYTVRDKMSKRFRKRIDIYMGLDRRAALRWGRRSVVMSW